MIIAVDFDGVIVKDAFPEIGDPNWRIVTALWRLKHTEHELVLWTCRVGDRLKEALQWCKDHDLEFTSINEATPSNLQEFGTDPRKVYADIYIDDKALGFGPDIAGRKLESLIQQEENKNGKR